MKKVISTILSLAFLAGTCMNISFAEEPQMASANQETTLNICHSLEKYNDKQIWNERLKIENLIKQELKNGTDFVERTDNFIGKNENTVYAYLTRDALSKVIKFLTPDLTEIEFTEKLESIKKCEEKIYTKKRNFAFIASNVVAFLISGAVIFKDKIFSKKLWEEKANIKPKENQSEKNKALQRDIFLKKLIKWLFCGFGMGAVLFVVPYSILRFCFPNHSKDIENFYNEYESKILAAKVNLDNIKYGFWKNNDAIALSFVPYENSPTVVSSGFINIGINNTENLKTNIERFKVQLEELIKKYDILR